ncbi:restriction endonuclease subunit M [Lactobacillus sp. CBA3605]|nr:restriction endonuclease subunit M [Lactobacillus sp. CBA3605]
MDKTAIKNFAINARRKLIADTKLKAAMLGITEEGIASKLATSTSEIEYYVDDRNPITGSDIGKRQRLVTELLQRATNSDLKTAFNDLVEEIAYTWFNRLIAIRFMEVNDYLPSRTRVLSSSQGRHEPDIMIDPIVLEPYLGHFTDEELDLIKVAQETELTTDMDRLYRMLFIKQANALYKNLPHLFEKTNDYAELLFTPNYHDGVIQQLITTIPVADFDVAQGGQVEIIGWLYQYYNTEPKNNVISTPKAHKFRNTEIASATQIFTPDWIVKYMVENSLGKLWVEHLISIGDNRSEIEIANSFNWNYYVKDAPQSEEIQNIVITDQSLSNHTLATIKVIDPAMGSGHILVYAFEVLITIYQSEGFSKRDAVKEIITKNLNGLDIDNRAFQLTYFSIMMKARQYDRRALSNIKSINVFGIPSISEANENFNILLTQLENNNAKILKKLLIDFSDGKEIGSLIAEPNVGYSALNENLSQLNQRQLSFELIPLIEKAEKVLQVAQLLKQSYDVVITNPPYMGSSRMSQKLKKFAEKNHPDTKSDLFSMFIERWNQALKSNGFNAMVTMQSWMFLSSFEKMRKNILNKYVISSLMHMENNVMGIAFGTAVTILRNTVLPGFIGTYHQIKTKDVSTGIPESVPIAGNRYNRTNQANFSKIPGSPIAYWISEHMRSIYQDNKKLTDIYRPMVGMTTSNNKKFVFFWQEVNYENSIYISHTHPTWFPYAKGGGYRKWYGFERYFVNWKNNGLEIKKYKKFGNSLSASVRNERYYMQPGITWSAITSSRFSARILPKNHIFDSGGSAIFPNEKSTLWVLSLMNSKIMWKNLLLKNPTLNFQTSDIGTLPVIFDNNKNVVANLGKRCISYAKKDWDSFETSWDFARHPLLAHIADDKQKEVGGKLENAFGLWKVEAQQRFDQLKANEEELNRIFIDLYGLNDELTPDVADKDVSVRLADEVRDTKSFLSYFVGVVFGRYSLDVEGLIFAGGEWNSDNYQKFVPNQDNLMMLNDEHYFNDDRDIINRLKQFLEVVFGRDTLQANLDYIARIVGKKAENSEAAIRRYFVEDFFKDHKKVYQKKPIYWEFSSGRQNGFKALMYLHRYDNTELAMIRTDYLHPLQGKYETRLSQLQQLSADESMAKRKKQLERDIKHVNQQINELKSYDPIIQHLANEQISLDLDDGVSVNYSKLQDGEKVLSKI